MGELFPAWRYHAVFTDSPFELVQAEASTATTPSSSRSSPTCTPAPSPTCHPVISGPTPPGSSIAAMAHNLLRAAGTLAGRRYAKARTATIRRDLIAIPPAPPATAAATSSSTCPQAITASRRMAEPVDRNLRPARRAA
jgi:hypothetical protein